MYGPDTERKNLEWEKKIRDMYGKRERELERWGPDSNWAKAHDMLEQATARAMGKPPIQNIPVSVPEKKETTLESLLTPQDYALLAGMQISLG